MENNQQPNKHDEDNIVFSGARASAIRILSRFDRSDSYIDKLVDYELNTGKLNELDKSLLTEIVNGVVRWRAKLDWVLSGFFHGDYLKSLNIVKNAMRVALYQMQYLDRIPVHAAINESVEIVKKIQGAKTAGLVNGVLRNISRNMKKIRYPERSNDIVYYFMVIYSHPRWIVRRWVNRYGEENAETLLKFNNQKPDLTFRINNKKSSVVKVSDYLKTKKIRFAISKYHKDSLIIQAQKIHPGSLDIFVNGDVAIQDTSATLAATLAAPKENQFVADLCAAPGGKSFVLADLMNDNGKVIAIEKYKSKLKLIEKGAKRLGLQSIETMEEDASIVYFDDEPDLVFCDVPCSGLGTLRKKPDIKWKRDLEDIHKVAEIQKEILSNAADIVKAGGAIVYSTCTIEPEENEENIKWFLENYPEFKLDPAENYLPKEVCRDGFMQTLPHVHGMDGAFAARLIKIEE